VDRREQARGLAQELAAATRYDVVQWFPAVLAALDAGITVEQVRRMDEQLRRIPEGGGLRPVSLRIAADAVAGWPDRTE
jgi:hypothetical protein